ncbi:unnamed protein product, partial [marine sediment metagenome]
AFGDIGEDTIGSLAECETATEKLLMLADSMVGLADEAEGLFMLFLGYWASSDREQGSAQIWVDVLRRYKDVVVEVVEEGVRRGEFKPVNAEGLVWALLAAYDGLAAYAVIMPDLDLKRINRTFVETLLGGLLLREASAQVRVRVLGQNG